MPLSTFSAVVVTALTAATLWSLPVEATTPPPTNQYGVTDEELRLLVASDHFELDHHGALRSVEPLLTPANTTPVMRAPDDLFTLHSRPGSPHTLYLDFDGHTVQDTEWRGGAHIDAPP